MPIFLILVVISYNPLERREASKGGKEACKKAPPSQSSTKGSTAGPRPHSSQSARRNDAPAAVNSSSQHVKPSKAPSAVSAYDEQITELKLSVDSLEKERDFYFAKLRDIEILCQSLEIEGLAVLFLHLLL